eukprot:31488-Pelagococcus_subviridis.AAC.3
MIQRMILYFRIIHSTRVSTDRTLIASAITTPTSQYVATYLRTKVVRTAYVYSMCRARLVCKWVLYSTEVEVLPYVIFGQIPKGPRSFERLLFPRDASLSATTQPFRANVTYSGTKLSSLETRDPFGQISRIRTRDF